MKSDTRKFIKVILTISLVMCIVTIILLVMSGLRESNNMYIAVDPDSVEFVQFEPPAQSDPIAIVQTSLGELRFVLYPQYSPSAVANFIELAQSGYYDDTYVFNSESGVYCSAGSKDPYGNFSQSDPHEHIQRELHQNLWTFKGAVCMMNTSYERTFKEKLLGGGDYFNGSRFSIINTIEFTDEIKQQMNQYSQNSKITDAFIQNGGIPNFSQQMTVIGQVYQGMDVAEKLSSLKATDNGKYKVPDEEVKIISVTISEYSENNEK